jgi:tetratricopeptide (TPR) repeat protein
VTVGIACLLLAIGTIARNREYGSRLTIAQTIVDRWPNGRGFFLLGSELIAAGRKDEAMAQLRASARDYPGAHFALGTELLADGKVDDAIAEIQAFLRALPGHPSAAPAHDMLGRAYLAQRKFGDAAEQFRILVDTAPSYRGPNNDILFNLGYSQRAVASNPGDRAASDLLARVRAAAATNR